MKWLNHILGGRKNERNGKTLALTSVESWLLERQKSSGFEERLQTIYERLEEVAADLQESTRALEFAKPDESTPPKLLRAGLAARGETAKQMASLAEKLKPPRGKDIDAASEHHWALVKGLERTATTFSRAQRFAAALFPKEIEAVNKELTRTSSILVGLESEICQRRREQEEIWYSRKLVEELKEDLSTLADLRRRAISEESELVELSASVRSLEEEKSRHAASSEGRRMEETKSSLEELRAKLEREEEEMASLVAPLGKALSRIMKQGSSDRLSIRHQNVFEKLSTDPGSISDEEIAGSLQELRAHLEALGLKDRKKEKTLAHIDLLMTKGALQGARSRLEELRREIEEKDALLAEICRAPSELRERLLLARRGHRDLEAALLLSRQEIASREEKVARNRQELQERLSKLSGAPVEIDLSA